MKANVLLLVVASSSWRMLLMILFPLSCALTTPTSSYSFRDSWSVITLGDLHMEDDMSFHEQARQDCLDALKEYPLLGRGDDTKNGAATTTTTTTTCLPLSESYLKTLQQTPAGDLTTEQLQLLLNRKKQGEYCQCHVVSLGDLGRKNDRHEPGDAGTTKCFESAKGYLDGFGIPYDLVTGNHDMKGLQEFETDSDNLNAWMKCFDKSTPHFSRYVGEKTLLLGLSTVRFRDSPYSFHEVYIDDKQIEWFRNMVESHSANDGWKILVFSHAPITGSGLRVLQKVHVTSGCAWLNHSSEATRNAFIQIVKENPQIKCWSSGHFHLSHEFQDSLVQVGSCVFVQVGVMGRQSTRDGRRQSRLFRGCGDVSIEIYSINHHVRVPNKDKKDETDRDTKAEVRLDAKIDLKTGKLVYAHGSDLLNGSGSVSSIERDPEWFQAYVPQEEDGCYLENPDGSIGDATDGAKVCWWHMADGKVLGLHQGQLVEYDAETLAPIGVVVTEEQLHGREVLLVQNKKTLVLVDDAKHEMQVIHPNRDGSYWRKFWNKKRRLEEKAREEVFAKRWVEKQQQRQQEQM